MTQTPLHTFETSIREINLEVDIWTYWPEQSAKVSGPPEYCYPAEDAEVEFSTRPPIELTDTEWDTLHLEAISEMESLEEAARDEVAIARWEDQYYADY